MSPRLCPPAAMLGLTKLGHGLGWTFSGLRATWPG